MSQAYFPIGDTFRRVMTQYHYCDHCKLKEKCATGYACTEYKRWALQENASLAPFDPRLINGDFNPKPTRKNYKIIFMMGDDNSHIN